MLTVQLGNDRRVFEQWRPDHGQVFRQFAYDTETTLIDDEHPEVIPRVVVATATDGKRGCIIHRNDVAAFFAAHRGVPFIGHNVAFDLAVSQDLLGPQYDLYAQVDAGDIWCTMILHKLWSLATAGHTDRDGCSLRDCVQQHLGIDLPKTVLGPSGTPIRLDFGRYLGGPLTQIPAESLRYAARDVMATWSLFCTLDQKIHGVLEHNAREAYGFVNESRLGDMVERFGPLTHHIQLRASILMDALTRTGIAIDVDRVAAKSAAVERQIQACLQALDARGYSPGREGNSQVLQRALETVAAANPDIVLSRTASGACWSTAGEHLEQVAFLDPFFGAYLEFRHAQKLQGTYLAKMQRPEVRARFGYLAATGRTYCGGGLNLQNLPKEDGQCDGTAECPSIRAAFVPRQGHVFIDSDLSQIELVVLGFVWRHQLGIGESLYDLVNSGQDVHRRIAAAVLGKQLDEVTRADRNSVKPVSFGRPGGMSANTLRRIAHRNYGLDLSLDEVNERIQAYHRLCPELDAFLQDEVDVGTILAEQLHLTTGDYDRATGSRSSSSSGANSHEGWLGGMLLRSLAEAAPCTRETGRQYTPAELDYFWTQAQQLVADLPPDQARALLGRQPSPDLSQAVRDWVGRRPVITVTGRMRANATFCASRNTLFQGVAADGAILGLWRIWRAGHRIVSFIHDQVVVESPADATVPAKVREIERHMIDGILDVVPGMRVSVESVVTRSLDKSELDPRYSHEPGT